jgi:hypothetical protein
VSSPHASVLELQGAAGNRAVAQLVAGTRQLARYRGDGKHRPSDVAFATKVGQADAAGLDATTDTLSAATRKEINEKLAWFQGPAKAAYASAVKGALTRATTPSIEMPEVKIVQPLSAGERNALERQVNDWYGLIQKLQALRIDAWEKNARIPEAKPSIDAMGVVIAIVALGFGGVAYGVIEKMLNPKMNHLLKEFVLLSGLEAADLLAEGIFHHAVNSVKTDIDIGIKDASTSDNVYKAARGALKKGNDPVSFYAEAIKLHTLTQEAAEHQNFNKKSASMSDQDLKTKNAALKLIYDELISDPDAYQRELSAGFMRLIEESRREEKAKKWGGNRQLEYAYDRNWTMLRAGEVNLNPRTRDKKVHFFGSWANPNLNVDGFEAVTGGINKETFENLNDSEVEKLGVTMQFTCWAKNPYSGGWTNETIDIIFERDASGRFRVIDFENPKEWLTSYYTGESRDHTDDERDKFAPLGAEKLYNALKSKRVKSTRIVELFEEF